MLQHWNIFKLLHYKWTFSFLELSTTPLQRVLHSALELKMTRIAGSNPVYGMDESAFFLLPCVGTELTIGRFPI
jgi:hypothetical protein